MPTSRPGVMTPGWHHEDADPEIARAAVAYSESRTRAGQRHNLCEDPGEQHNLWDIHPERPS